MDLFKLIIEQKDVIIKELRDKIDLLYDKIALLEEVKLLNGKIESVVEDEKSKSSGKIVIDNLIESESTEVKVNSDVNSELEIVDSCKQTVTTNAINLASYSDAVKSNVNNEDNQVCYDAEWTVVSNKNKLKVKSAKSEKSTTKTKFRNVAITGTSTTGKLNVVQKMNFLFISRLDPDIETNDILEYLQDRKAGSYQIEKLKAKYPNYSSFKIGVPASLIDEVFSSSFWPSGVLVCKYRFPKETVNFREGEALDAKG